MKIDILDYIKLVMADYRAKSARNELSPLLTNPTTARIKEACEKAAKGMIAKSDEKTLEDFFGIPESPKTLVHLIQKTETDKFKPLVNYLKGLTRKTDDRNIELLAWLTRFPHRPFGGFGKMVNLTEEELMVFKKGDSGKVEEEIITRLSGADPADQESFDPKNETNAGYSSEAKIESEQLPVVKRRSPVLIIGAILAAMSLWYVGVVLFKPWQGASQKPGFVGANGVGCMYWDNDHYEEIPCDVNREGILKLALDNDKMKNFKKILRPDTITTYSIGKLYYLQTDNKIECFTLGGKHPVYTNRSLRKLTETIYNKHILKDRKIQGRTTL